ncbi:hypothetical protein C1752_03198 [Acaryochloris thomasi RCC1774]|uniref:Sulfotransferase domain-containing protein n=1 Tax=Acaryochloris thomasi RCC1774 TaxID=1764569 RepID=A0A2W1JPJ7_9CYAN|nr:sulfotransferase domain-containing protein [Acaryochloris thomasi]PZD72812.1 hypothetical protein C1752_03198 [Acaryochloris thomasi RCC1774]
MTYLFRSAARYIFQHINPFLFDTVAINEFPKSGGTWTGKVISNYLGYRFDDNIIPKYGAAIVKYHKLQIPSALKEVVIIRDPRDVIISFYYHSFFIFADNPFNARIVSLSKKRFNFDDYSDIAANIPTFIDYMLDGPIKPGFRWDHFYNIKIKSGIPIFKYEDLRHSPLETFSQILESLGFQDIDQQKLSGSIEKYNIKKIKKKNDSSQGKVNFVRSGKVNGWQDILLKQDNNKIRKNFSSIMEIFQYD